MADRIVKVVNARAVTVYLGHEVTLMLSVPLTDLLWEVPALEQHLALDSSWFQFAVTRILIAAAVVAFGWVEDVAARSPPRLLP